MADSEANVPRPDDLETWYRLIDVRIQDGRIIYYGEPLIPERQLFDKLWPAFQQAGYELKLAQSDRSPGTALVADPIEDDESSGLPWTNIGLFVVTVLSTLFVGASVWYYVPIGEITSNPLSVLEAWPFTVAVLGVLLTHELGHYAMGRYHDVDVSLPYLIPFPTYFGTLGAVIRMRGRIPSRKALFDIGVAGPLAGLVATVVVTVAGLYADPITVPDQILSDPGSTSIRFNYPLLLQGLGAL